MKVRVLLILSQKLYGNSPTYPVYNWQSRCLCSSMRESLRQQYLVDRAFFYASWQSGSI
ncbi:hypothetical protein [Microcoleus sp. POL10_C6]|uniref:hypothetical protein n=1 Tax=unclassified Microcoleus TaxID=2642155 RepID=UPI002FD55316